MVMPKISSDVLKLVSIHRHAKSNAIRLLSSQEDAKKPNILPVSLSQMWRNLISSTLSGRTGGRTDGKSVGQSSAE